MLELGKWKPVQARHTLAMVPAAHLEQGCGLWAAGAILSCSDHLDMTGYLDTGEEQRPQVYVQCWGHTAASSSLVLSLFQ